MSLDADKIIVLNRERNRLHYAIINSMEVLRGLIENAKNARREGGGDLKQISIAVFETFRMITLYAVASCTASRRDLRNKLFSSGLVRVDDSGSLVSRADDISKLIDVALEDLEASSKRNNECVEVFRYLKKIKPDAYWVRMIDRYSLEEAGFIDWSEALEVAERLYSEMGKVMGILAEKRLIDSTNSRI